MSTMFLQIFSRKCQNWNNNFWFRNYANEELEEIWNMTLYFKQNWDPNGKGFHGETLVNLENLYFTESCFLQQRTGKSDFLSDYFYTLDSGLYCNEFDLYTDKILPKMLKVAASRCIIPRSDFTDLRLSIFLAVFPPPPSLNSNIVDKFCWSTKKKDRCSLHKITQYTI